MRAIAASRPVQKQKTFSISQILATFLSVLLFLYFAYHLVHGDRGYFALKGLEQKLVTAEQKHIQKKHEREQLETRVRLMRPDSLDTDLLDERVRTVLGYMKPEERVILDAKAP